MRLILGPRGDPLLEQVLLGGVEGLVRASAGGMTSSGSSEKIRAISSLSSSLPGAIAPALMASSRRSSRRSALREAAVGAVAAEAGLAEDRPDVAVELDLAGRPSTGRLPRERACSPGPGRRRQPRVDRGRRMVPVPCWLIGGLRSRRREAARIGQGADLGRRGRRQSRKERSAGGVERGVSVASGSCDSSSV